VAAEALALLGFHEGTKRVVQCKGGFLKGLEVQFVPESWSFSEPFIGNVRLLCSRYAPCKLSQARHVAGEWQWRGPIF
jgi:hypothetical protein